MPKIYHALGGQTFEVAKVTLENCKKVQDHCEKNSYPVTVNINSVNKVINAVSIRLLELGSVVQSHTVYSDDSIGYIIRKLGSNEFEIMSQGEYDKMVWRPEHYLVQLFQYKHLPEHLQEVSKPICELAQHLDKILPNNPEKTTALRKLREAKDCAVTATLFKS